MQLNDGLHGSESIGNEFVAFAQVDSNGVQHEA